MNLRRARPTIRLLREDLASDWASPQPKRDVQSGDLSELHPLSALPHPIIAKAVASFSDEPDDDNFVGPITSSTKLSLLEIKSGQWRGGVWRDSELDVCWVVVAGLAKGNHEDYDDFYSRVARENADGDPSKWLPTAEDIRLLKRERAAQLMSAWELATQELVLNALQQIHTGGTERFELPHPIPGTGRMATVTIVVSEVREDAYAADEIVADIEPDRRYASSNLFWQATTRVLTTLYPPQQGWDRFKDTYSNIAAPGHWSDRVAELEKLSERKELAESVPGQTAHYAHKDHIAGSVVQGTAMRALCGVYFVTTQLPDELPPCPECTDRWSQLCS